jgi:phosphatidylserine/phosphatidylglycerophosphate/cardiolipin synthase-like enzyme
MIVGDTVGFVGATNFDYRSRLYNSEMGFFFDSEELAQATSAEFIRRPRIPGLCGGSETS